MTSGLCSSILDAASRGSSISPKTRVSHPFVRIPDLSYHLFIYLFVVSIKFIFLSRGKIVNSFLKNATLLHYSTLEHKDH